MVCTSEIWIDIKSTNLRRTLFCILVPLAIIDVPSHQTDVQKQPFFNRLRIEYFTDIPWSFPCDCGVAKLQNGTFMISTNIKLPGFCPSILES